MFWLFGVLSLLCVHFGWLVLEGGGDAWPFVWWACVFLVVSGVLGFRRG